MSRTNIDGEAFTDPRIGKRLPRNTGLGYFDALGRLVCVWNLAITRKRAELPVVDVDDTADHSGFAAAMVLSNLADQLDADHVRIRGVEDRITYLHKQSENAAKGGKARAQGATRSGGRFQPTAGSSPADRQRPAGANQPPAGDSPADSSQRPADLDLDLVPDHDQDPDPGRGKERSAAASPRTPRARAGDGSRSKKPSQIEIPPEWTPTAAHRERALALGVDVDRSAERFRNHHAGALFNGWAAINGRFTNWIDGDKARGPVNGKPSNVGPVRAAAGTDEDAFSGELPI